MTNICVIGVYVDDIKEAERFYTDVLGFGVVNRYADGCIVQLENEGPTLILEETKEKNPAKYPESSQVVLAIESKDIEKTVEEFRAKGVEFIQEKPGPFPAGVFIAFKDPAGNLIELLQFSD